MSEQPELFEEPAPVLRPPGWQLVSETDGGSGWHLIRAVQRGNSVTTTCGLTGRVIASDERQIVLCSDCQAAVPS